MTKTATVGVAAGTIRGVAVGRVVMRARVRDTELYFDVDGMGLVPDGARMVERPTLFLVHGGPGGEHSRFKTNSGALRDVAQLVYVDHRGSGRSAEGDPATYTLDNNIDDLDALARAPRAPADLDAGLLVRRDGRPGLRAPLPRAGREPDPRLHVAELPVHRRRPRHREGAGHARPDPRLRAALAGHLRELRPAARVLLRHGAALLAPVPGRGVRRRLGAGQALLRRAQPGLRRLPADVRLHRAPPRDPLPHPGHRGRARLDLPAPALAAHRRADPARAAQDLRGQRPRGGEPTSPTPTWPRCGAS